MNEYILEYLKQVTKYTERIYFENPELQQLSNKMELWKEVCRQMGKVIDPETVFRVGRKLRNEPDLEKERVYRQFFSSR